MTKNQKFHLRLTGADAAQLQHLASVTHRKRADVVRLLIRTAQVRQQPALIAPIVAPLEMEADEPDMEMEVSTEQDKQQDGGKREES